MRFSSHIELQSIENIEYRQHIHYDFFNIFSYFLLLKLAQFYFMLLNFNDESAGQKKITRKWWGTTL
jgi:hypothetical protein